MLSGRPRSCERVCLRLIGGEGESRFLGVKTVAIRLDPHKIRLEYDCYDRRRRDGGGPKCGVEPFGFELMGSVLYASPHDIEYVSAWVAQVGFKFTHTNYCF